MTPSAARGILEAILWKPAIRWRVERIHVLAPIRFIAVKRNEVTRKAAVTGDVGRFFVDEDRIRAQRNTLMLRDVDYVIEASFELTAKVGPDDNLQKFVEMFQRRLARGQCFHTPYLGCREFAARVDLAPENWETPAELRERRSLGMILHDLAFAPNGSGEARPFFFEATLENGRIAVPEVPR
jgi:CRISPR-associated protein Cas5d